MGQSKSEIADGRAHTDASLDAERAILDAASASSAVAARRLLDDLIERDRNLADIRLVRFRDGADSRVSRERANSPSPSSSVSHERDAADQRTEAERCVTDALLLHERERSDIAVGAERCDHDALHTGLEARRQETDRQLSSEREGADSTATALGETRNVLGETRSALDEAHTEQGRQTDILGVVAHDLRSPLSVISLRAECIAEATHEVGLHAAAQAIELAVARMERLISDLLDVARIASGTLHIIKQRHDVGTLLFEVFHSYEPMFRARDIQFTAGTPPETIETSFDRDRIVQVLSNLLANAMKFTPGGGMVTLLAEREATAVVFTVRDDGPGIAPSALPHIFERFWQIDSDARRGLGLGLHICDNIIQAHGGRIWAQSEIGKGSTFRFTLPNSTS